MTTQEFQKKIKRVLITEQEIQDKIQEVGIRGQAAAAGEYPQRGIRVYGRPVPCYYHSL